MWQLYSTITEMEARGYPDDAVWATVRSMIFADCRAEDENASHAEADAFALAARSHLAATIRGMEDPFAGRAA